MRTGQYRFVRAKTVLLATGAGPSMYRYHTPSGDKTCDGLAMALRYGLPLRDMEMVQFHPTGILAGNSTRMTGTILEEGLRGAGGYLLNGSGDRFMSNYHPAAERATRDIVSRSMYNEIREGRTTPQGGLYIAMAHLGPDTVRDKFPGMVKRCDDCGFDLAGGRVEVVPTAHYMMGGIEMEMDCATRSPGLYVAGEDAGGVHGANRLGGNGVANSTVYGGIAGEAMAHAIANGAPMRDPDPQTIDQGIARAEYPFSQPPGDSMTIREQLWSDMWDHVGIVRTAEDIRKGQSEIAEHRNELMEIGLNDGDRSFNLTWHDWLNLDSLLSVSDVIAAASLAREDSRGAHFRADFPETGDLDTTTYTQICMDDERLIEKMMAVDFSIVKPGESLIDDEAGAPPPSQTN
jgi:fumarate reductase flavoprotein subunit